MYKTTTIEGKVVIEIDDFITSNECDELLTSRVLHFEKADSHYPENYRNNDRYVEDNHPLANYLFSKLKEIKPLSDLICLNERIRFCQYQTGQQFSKHQDGIYYSNNLHASKYTFLLYLNEKFKGGFTTFYTSKSKTTPTKKIIPKKGKLVLFDHSIWHKGCVVTEGKKYILRSDIIVNNNNKNTHHQGYIWSLTKYDKTNIISSGRDTYIKLWNQNLVLKTSFKMHSKSIVKVLSLTTKCFISSSRDFTIKKWNIHGELLQEIKLEEMIISLLKYKGDIIATGTSGSAYFLSSDLVLLDKLIINNNWIWDTLLFSEHQLISCCENGNVSITNLLTQTSHQICSYDSPIFCLHLNNNRLFMGANDGCMLMLSFEDYKITTYNIHQDAIRSIVSNNDYLYSCGEDNRVMATDINKGNTKEIFKSNNFLQDLLIIKDTLYAAGYDGKIFKIDI